MLTIRALPKMSHLDGWVVERNTLFVASSFGTAGVGLASAVSYAGED